MITVDLWVKQADGRASWLRPVNFVSVMIVCGLLGMQGIKISYVERCCKRYYGTAAHFVDFDSSAAGSKRHYRWLFALCHGDMNGLEMPKTLSGLSYAPGFMVFTIMLNLAGIGIATALSGTAHSKWLRLTGIRISPIGSALYFA